MEMKRETRVWNIFCTWYGNGEIRFPDVLREVEHNFDLEEGVGICIFKALVIRRKIILEMEKPTYRSQGRKMDYGGEIYVNEIIRYVVHEKTYQVLWISTPVSFLYWISLDNAERIPKKLDVAEIGAGLESGDYVASGETEISLMDEDKLADETKMHRDRIWTC